MGYYWASLCSVLALTAFADWSSSDSQLLQYLQTDVEDIESLARGDSATLTGIESELQQLNYDIGYSSSGNDTVLANLGYIKAACEALSQDIQTKLDSTLNLSVSIPYQNTHDYKVYSRLNDMRQDINTGFDTLFDTISALGSLSNSVNALVSHIDNITNYLCYSPQYSGAFTNLSTFFQAYSWGSWGNVSEEVRFLLEDILCRVPTQSEVERATDLVYYNGSGTRFLAEYLSKIDPEVLPSTQWISFIQQIRSWYQGSEKPSLQNMGPLYYYQYQTRDLTTLTENINSNLVNSIIPVLNTITNRLYTGTDLDNAIVSNSLFSSDGTFDNSNSSTVSRVSYSLGSVFGLSNTDTPQTNDVSPISDSNLTTQENDIKYDTLNTSLSEAASSINSQTDSFIDSLTSYSDETSGFSIESPEFSVPTLGISTTSQTFTIHPISRSNFTLINHFLNLLRAFCVLVFASLCIRRVVLQQKWNDEEPF